MKLSYMKIGLLAFIVLVAAAFRLYALGSFPVGFHIDEASLGYNGYSILKTGKDEHGNRFPLYIDMFGDNRPSGYHFLTVAPIAVFGLNEFATRLPGAVFGILTVIAIYWFTVELFGDTAIALVAALFLALSPWHTVSSRASAEAIVALFFILTGAAAILSGLRLRRARSLTAGLMLMAVSFFFYHTPRVFVPMLICLFAGYVFLNRQSYKRRFILVGGLTATGVIALSLVLVFVVKGGVGRFSQVNIFGAPQTQLLINEELREDGVRNVPLVITRMFHNKITAYTTTFVKNYFEYFSGEFLFISGGRPLWYKVPHIGMLYLIEFPFIVLGAAYLITHRKLLYKLPVVWLAVAPLTASLTTDDIPNIQRSLVMFPMLEIIAAYGLIVTLRRIKPRFVTPVAGVLSLALVFNVGFFLHQYYVHGSAHETIYRFNGFKEMVLAVKQVYSQYDHIIITKTAGGIYPHVLFFMQYDPATYQAEGSPKDPDFGGFGKFVFAPQQCPSIDGDVRLPADGRILYVDNGSCKIPKLIKQQKIYREDGTVAFIIVDRAKKPQ